MANFLERIAVLAILGLAGCGEEPTSEVDIDSLLQKAAANDSAPFEAAFAEVKGKKVAWSGAVVESQRVFGDDYVEEGILIVDVDPASAPPEAEVRFNIPPSRIDDFKPGQAVKFTGIIREFELRNGPPLLVLEMKDVN